MVKIVLKSIQYLWRHARSYEKEGLFYDIQIFDFYSGFLNNFFSYDSCSVNYEHPKKKKKKINKLKSSRSQVMDMRQLMFIHTD